MRTSSRRGAGLTEYLVIIALIAIATIGAVTLFSNQVRDLFGGSADALAGEESVPRRFGAGNDPGKKTLATFAQSGAGADQCSNGSCSAF